jgi:hypothetical protein
VNFVDGMWLKSGSPGLRRCLGEMTFFRFVDPRQIWEEGPTDSRVAPSHFFPNVIHHGDGQTQLDGRWSARQ